ncbi:hypothetical protein AVEN_273948-1 [Araneus ventricosus]|uniref:RNase H type-1 domain-containing protein n=1 Tax=Araneus ventricosus TaxID=182803 RepID=A0A4Y2HN75_ARAVE|nr:hypothetical protein AVEN_273948-1 [Araneus ventricosus]
MTSKQSPYNIVFRAQTIAIKEAINWDNSKGISTSIWSDSKSALKAISSFKSYKPLFQETQQALFQNPSSQLNWIKAHVGFLGNEAADNLPQQATKEGTHLQLQAPKMSSEEGLRNLSLNKWQQDWDSGDNGKAIFNILPVSLTQSSMRIPHGQENPSFSLRATIPFPAISTDSGFIIPMHAGRRETLSTTQFLVILRHHFIFQAKCRKYSTLVGKLTFK